MRTLMLPIALIVGLTCHACAQDHLVPESGSLNERPAALEYAKRLRAAMFENSSHYRARVICEPALQSAWAVTLVCEEKGGRPEYFVEYVVLVDDEDMKDGEFRAKKGRVRLDGQTAEAVQEVWFRMLRSVRYLEDTAHTRVIADGVTYHFSRFVPPGDARVPTGFETGQVFSPEPNSTTRRLASLGDAMRDYALASQANRANLRERILKLASSLKSELDQKPTRDSKK